MKDPDEIVPPNRNLVLIALRAEKSRDRIPFTVLDDFRLDLGHRSAIQALVRGSFVVDIAIPAYAVNCTIAPRTERLRSSNRLPSTPRSSA